MRGRQKGYAMDAAEPAWNCRSIGTSPQERVCHALAWHTSSGPLLRRVLIKLLGGLAEVVQLERFADERDGARLAPRTDWYLKVRIALGVSSTFSEGLSARRGHSMPDAHTVRVSVRLYRSPVALLTGGRAYRGSADSPAGFLQLTTTGRTSGKQRRVHLISIRDGSGSLSTLK